MCIIKHPLSREQWLEKVKIVKNFWKWFWGVVWRWRYNTGGNISDVGACCQHCDRELVLREKSRWPFVYTLDCPMHGAQCESNGGISGNPDELEILQNVKIEIRRTIRSG